MDRNFKNNGSVGFVTDVALHPEGVDRNILSPLSIERLLVALHPEGVDRNCFGYRRNYNYRVALHPEGVDRNPVLVIIAM